MPNFEKNSSEYNARVEILRNRISDLEKESSFLDARIAENIRLMRELLAMPEPQQEIQSVRNMMRFS